MFRINTPLRRVDDVNRLVSAGADAFYCGLNDQPGTFGGGGLNQRQSDRSSFASVDELARAVSLVHGHGHEVFLAANTRLLAESYVDRFVRQLQTAVDCGIDAVIVGSLNGLMIARQRFPGMRLAASVGLGVLNSRSARFFKDLGVYRVIVSRHLTPDEIATVCDEVPDVEVEAFLMNGRCGNFDSMCGYDYYDPEGAKANFTGCVFVRDGRVTRYRRYACGLCALDVFGIKPNFAAAKVIGRDFDVESVEKAVRLVAMARQSLLSGVRGEAFQDAVRGYYSQVHDTGCGGNCYYPVPDRIPACDEGCGGCGCGDCGGRAG